MRQMVVAMMVAERKPDFISFHMLEKYFSCGMCPVPIPRIVLALAWSPRFPERAEMAGMKLTMRV